jgi:hypothetical protein
MPVAENATPADQFEGAIAKKGSVLFRSWNGKTIGTDCDTEITFFPGGNVEMVEYGIGVNHYTGNYAIAKDGKISAEFKDFGQPWPVMILGQDTKGLVLRRADGKKGFIFGNRGGATVPGDAGTFWPFRAVDKALGESM